ncbi:MAG: SusD/RagB family nutrient-binding outer membrane lipoprotein [Sinomicrobium sp.]|nr:SusD/RagB family nutrient-binding outer membrane lipoprotein [Sinomicrobium sp.]
MKKISKYLLATGLTGILVFGSCETGELNLTENPNALVPEQASVDFFLNSIQEDFIRHIDGDADYDINDNFSSGGNTNGDGLSNIGLELTRLDNMSGRQYISAYQGSDFDDEWDNAYRGILTDIRAMTPLAEAAGQTRHLGIAQFIEAYVIVSLVDFFGNIPYSEALQGASNLNPALDDGASVYAAALNLLDQAVVNFQNEASTEPVVDLYYQNDYDAWIRAANTLRMKIYLQARLVDGAALANFNTIVNSGNYITDSDQDFQFNWPASSGSNPDVRHPRYGLNYQGTGAGDYLSNWLMNLMDTANDPRIRYYFYRQTDAVPGAEIPPNEELLSCSLESAPQHYLDGGFTFCYLNNGYWGRDHGDSDGVPPDGLLRTTYGVYPYGGRFDDDSFEAIAPGDGGGGRGITPILTASLVDFMIAEAAMAQNDVATAEAAMLQAVSKSIAKVQSFGALDPSADDSFAPSVADVNNYLNSIQAAFNAATMDGKWNILAEQYFIASFGNGIEAYNFYRRTGYPTTLQPNLEPDPGPFIRSLFYPSNAVNTNSNISQKPNQTQSVFWDNNPSGPLAN